MKELPQEGDKVAHQLWCPMRLEGRCGIKQSMKGGGQFVSVLFCKKTIKGRKVKVGNRLVDFMPLLDQSIPSTHAAGKTTSRLRHVIAQLESRGSYAALTPTAKRKWTNLVKHNRRDCEWASLLLTTSANF